MSTASATGTPPLVTDVAGLPGLAGTDLGRSSWRDIPQEAVDRFADLTDDHNFIHVDPERAAKTPFGGTIAHGYFTVSLLAPMLEELLRVEGASTSINYGMDRLRFPGPVPVGARIRTHGEITAAEEIKGGAQITVRATVEVENADRPGLAADCVFRHYA